MGMRNNLLHKVDVFWNYLPLASSILSSGLGMFMAVCPKRISYWEEKHTGKVRLIGVIFLLIGGLGSIAGYQQQNQLATKTDLTPIKEELKNLTGAINRPIVKHELHNKRIRVDLGEFKKQLLVCECGFRMGHGEGYSDGSKRFKEQCNRLLISIKNYLTNNLDSSYAVAFDYPEIDNLDPDRSKYRFEHQAESDSYRSKMRYLQKVIDEKK